MTPHPVAAPVGHRPVRLPARRDRSLGHRAEHGMVTAELAINLFAFALILVIALTGLATGMDHVKCAEASRVGARLAARAESDARITAGALAAAPSGSRVSIGWSGDTVTVTVRAPERPVFAALGFDIAAIGRSVAPREPGHG